MKGRNRRITNEETSELNVAADCTDVMSDFLEK